jgi:diguanylate cyclase (GGDEF)-like protein
VAAILHQNTRATDLCFRIGGDEFAVVMPSTTLASAGAVVERIDAAVVSARLAEGAVGISAGAAEASGQSLKELLATADAALYAEKRRRKSARA